MKRLKLGKIQWISLLVVSAMFANLCSHMVLAASASEQTKAKVTTTAAKKTTKTKQEEYKAFWFSYYDYDTYREKNKKRNAKTFRTYFTKVVKKEKSFGMNRVIVQVRPFGDAIYKSKYFPWSKYISGKQGRSPGYDPLKIMVDVAHKNGMKVEAWVNPYRVTIGSTNYSKLSKNNPARKWHAKKSTSRNVLAYNGSLYYNPSKKDVRNLIINGAKEIVKSIAPEFLEVTNAVLDEAEKIFGKIDRMVLFPLADHIAFAVKRIQNHEQISNPLTEDIRVLFHMEFKAAESIRPLLQKQFGIDIEDDEVGYVALHIHSAIEDEKVSQAMQMARSVRECISMVEEAIGKPIDIASLSYNRLMNHIRYMVARALSGEKLKVNMNDYMEVKFPESFGMAQAVCDQVGESLGVKLEEVETGYLAMHIERVANDEREIEE